MDTVREIEGREEAEPKTNLSSDNGSNVAGANGSQSVDRGQPELVELTDRKTSLSTASSLPRRPTGPRTPAGKERSKRNAFKHGIFSKVVVLEELRRWEFDSLLRGLRNDLRPEGTLEAILVEKLASLIWRYRRMLIAEQAEIRRGTEYFWWDESIRQDQDATAFLKDQDKGNIRPGLMLGLRNPIIRQRCLEQLQLLKQFIETDGFDPDTDFKILRIVYGETALTSLTPCSVGIYYSRCLLDSRLTEEERMRRGSPSPDQCKANFVEELQRQIKRFEELGKVMERTTDSKGDVEELCHNVPEGPRLDRLLKYEASLERAFDRTLSQLERLQRMRLGQPVLPPIDVNVSAS